ncbi:transposase [Lentimicrobium sp. S6]|uniref:transposase n=1 Tax=Lentimicrobium sp. S6 TaxID=2735872 RepID=UPI00352F99A0
MYVHAIFGTTGRVNTIKPEIEEKLHSYMAGIFKNMNSPAIKKNSVPDHIHILFKLSKNHALAKVMEEVKKSTSKWMKEHGIIKFTWQIGYGAFSIQYNKVEIVISYIENQKEHHKETCFKQEFEKLIKENQMVDYNSNFFWDR